MASYSSFFRVRSIERTFLVLIIAVLGFFFFRLYSVYQQRFEEVPGRLKNGTIVDLNADQRAQRLQSLLQKGYYFEDPKDIEYIRTVVGRTMTTGEEEMDNIGELNKSAFDVNADEAYAKGGESFRKRVRLSRALMGFTDDDSARYEQEKKAPPALPAATPVGMGEYTISGSIQDKQEKPVGGGLVRLRMIFPEDSLYSNENEIDSTISQNTATVKKTYVIDTTGKRILQGLTVYARSGADGKYSFTGLPAHRAFEILPLKPGFQFGGSKGIGDLDDNVKFRFVEAPHTIRLFSTRDFNILKKEKALIVRLPAEVNKWYMIIVFTFFAAFVLLHLFLTVPRFRQADQFIIPVIMLLTGISLLTLLSIQDPLRDRFLGKTTLFYFLAGFVGICILLLFDIKRFTIDSGLYRLFTFRNSKSAANGWPWAILAVGLLMLTILFGTGPEGSGVKVNLFGFQPSEVVKFLLIVFLAGFFTMNERYISEYTRWNKRWSFFSLSLILIAFAILLFLILGDLGPAMVIGFTFIILFSFSRGDFAFAIGSVVLYVLTLWLMKNVLLATAVTAAAIVIASLFVRKQMSESALLVFFIIASFLLLDKVPYLDKLFPGPVQRLVDRKAIWQDPWNNEVFGGDHIANAIWAMSSGGVQGQGIGEGFAKTIPEAHTDMILPSMGEELGWAGILSIFILFRIYFHRAVIIGRHSGRPFLFYLCAGVGIGTFVQFLLIAGGSIGALPLSGVSLPFMSYGGSSLIMNMLAAGFLLSTSVVTGTEVQMKYISKQQDRNLVPALVAALVGVILLGVTVSKYLFNNKKWVVQPALVADRSGARMFSYNPRIAILMNRLGAGNLLDRKGRLLGTSKPEVIEQQSDSLVRLGLDAHYLQLLPHRRLDRYYPFAEQMFFWTGDYNTGIFMGATNGYYAEYEHIAELRGFHAPVTSFTVAATRFRENRFLPRQETEMTVTKRDFSVLAPLLLAGINSKQVEEFKKRNRDVQMTVDAGLQTKIQQSIALDTFKNSRISVVIMEDNTGDVLASAVYPLPTINEPDKMTLTRREQNQLPYWITNSDLGFTTATQPGSTAKLITAMAAFNKLGIAAATKRVTVRPGDLIRVKSEEPDETGSITIERAIVKSNNPFFIRLANEERLQEEMGNLYLKTGMFLHGVGGYYYEGDFNNSAQQEKWKELWRKTEFKSVNSYNPDNIRRTRGRGVSGMAWGQGELIATPAAVARMASGIANHGILLPHRFIMKVSDSVIAPATQGIPIAKEPAYAELMTKYMKEQSVTKIDKLKIYVAGKTGTPERIAKGDRINDGWYVFFAPKANGTGNIVVCIRIERAKGSSAAVALAGNHIIPLLLQYGYIKGFEGPVKQPGVPLPQQQQPPAGEGVPVRQQVVPVQQEEDTTR